MASIQQSLNQMLATAGVMSGLYAHSPAGQEAAEVRRIKHNEPKMTKLIEEASMGVKETPSTSDEIFTDAFKTGVEQSKRLFELRPSKKTASQYKEMKETFEEWESALKDSTEKRQKTLNEQKKALAMQQELLRNAPETLGVREKNIKWKEDNTDGK